MQMAYKAKCTMYTVHTVDYKVVYQEEKKFEIKNFKNSLFKN